LQANLEIFWPRINNLSASGISLFVHRRFELGRVMPARLINRASNSAFDVQIRVVALVELPGSSFVLGAAFHRNLSEDELRALV
jgi:hypothetical protein